jgi:excisionase family DNA binding protein
MTRDAFNVIDAFMRNDKTMNEKREQRPKVEIQNKILLSVKEASALSGVGEGKIRELIRRPRCPFVLYNGTKALLKRKEFEKFLSEQLEL